MRRHAIVILAHNSPESIKVLTDILSRDFDVYLHFDAKFEIPYELREVPKLHILENRVGVLWAEFSVWESMWISLYQVNKLHKYEDITFISANDFPLMKPKDIVRELNSTDRSLLNFNNTYSGKKLGDKIIPYGMILGEGKIPEADELVNKYLPYKYDEFKVDYLSDNIGSQWCTIKIHHIKYILKFLKESPEFIRAMKASLIVDEMAFQYIYAKLNLPYEDFHRKIEFNKCVAHPDEITEDEIIEMLKSGQDKYIFGRKVNITKFKKLDEIKSLLEVD